MTPWATKWTACWDEPHCRSTRGGGHVPGRPAGDPGVAGHVVALLAHLGDAAADHVVDPARVDARCGRRARCRVNPSRSVGCQLDSAPFRLPIGVRTVSTMTASRSDMAQTLLSPRSGGRSDLTGRQVGSAAMAAGVPVDVTGRPTELRDVDLDGFFHPQTVAVIGASDNPKRPNTAMTPQDPWPGPRSTAPRSTRSTRTATTIDGSTCFTVDAGRARRPRPGRDPGRRRRRRRSRRCWTRSPGSPSSSPPGSPRSAPTARPAAGPTRGRWSPRPTPTCSGRTPTSTPSRPSATTCPGRAIALITQSGHQGRPSSRPRTSGIALSALGADRQRGRPRVRRLRPLLRRPARGRRDRGLHRGLQGRPHADAGRRPRRPAGRPDRVRQGGPTDEGALDGPVPHRPPHRLRRGDVGRVPPVRRDPGRRPRRAPGHGRAARPGPRRPTTDGVCVYAISGGTGAHMADLAAGRRAAAPRPRRRRRRTTLREWIPGYLRVSNPVDSGGAPSADGRGRKILDAMLADPNVDVLICPITGRPADHEPTAGRGPGRRGRDHRQADLRRLGLAADRRPGLHRRAGALAASPCSAPSRNCVRRGEGVPRPPRVRGPLPLPVRQAGHAAGRRRPPTSSALLASDRDRCRSTSRSSCSPPTASRSPTTSCATRRPRRRRRPRPIGYPVVMKACSPDLAHKSDLGLVARRRRARRPRCAGPTPSWSSAPPATPTASSCARRRRRESSAWWACPRTSCSAPW